MPFATPKLRTGTTAANSFDTAGNPTLSPIPSSSRKPNTTGNECAAPMHMVAVAQTINPAASTRCAPKRSVNHPTGI